MLLVLIGPYFNHSHWSVSSLTEHILSPSLSPFPNLSLSVLHPLIHSLTHSHLTHTPSLSLPHSVCFTCPFIFSFIHSFSHLTLHHLTFTNCPLLPQLLQPSPILPLPRMSLSWTSFTLYFLPSLTSSLSSLSLFLSPSLIPVEQKSHQARERLLVPIVHSEQSDQRVAQRAAGRAYSQCCVFFTAWL